MPDARLDKGVQDVPASFKESKHRPDINPTMLPLVLYDIPSKLPGNNWTPNPAKTRFVLNYKNIPFDTVWVECPDIAPRMKEIGASPNKLPDGSERYTLPVVSDPNTGSVITDSWAIAVYLEETYPEKPIFPNGTRGLISSFHAALDELIKDCWGFGFLRTSQILNECSQERFIRAKEVVLGETLGEWSDGAKRGAYWEAIEKRFYGGVKSWYEQDGGKWVMGNTFSYADIILAARILWFKRVFLDDEWKRISSLHDGRWQTLLADVEKECGILF